MSGSSPQAWGCFLAVYGYDFPEVVFPTGVGVFPGKLMFW